MRHDKRLFVFSVLSVLLVLGSLGVGFYAERAAGRYFAREVVFVAPFGSEGGLAAPVSKNNVSFVSRGRQQIARGGRQVSASVIFCGADYFGIYNMNFLEGGPWHEAESVLPVIILNEALAWYLFGGINIVGLTVEADGESRQILGVVRQEGESAAAWMPGERRPFTAMYLWAEPFNPLDAGAEAVRLLHSLGVYRFSDYAIVDVGTYIESMGIRHRILLYSVWLYVLIVLLIALRRYSFREYKRCTPILAGVVVCVYALTGIHDIVTWLPNLADPNVSVFSYITNVGVLPPEAYLSYGMRQISRLNSYANYALGAGLAGLVCYYFAAPRKFISIHLRRKRALP